MEKSRLQGTWDVRADGREPHTAFAERFSPLCHFIGHVIVLTSACGALIWRVPKEALWKPDL